MSPDVKNGLAEDIYRALWAWSVCVLVTVVVSYATKPRPVSELEGLVYGVSKLPDEHDDFWYQKPIVWAGIVGAVFVVLNIIFW
jgi:SSS family solute:Na+ symporter